MDNDHYEVSTGAEVMHKETIVANLHYETLYPTIP